MKTASIQLCSGTDIKSNLDQASDLIKQATADGAKLILTPEMTHLMQRKPNSLFDAIKDEGEDLGVKHFSNLAKELSVNLIIGSLAIKTGERRAANRSYVFSPKGDILARYDKIHLFDVTLSKKQIYRESNVYDGGKQAVIANIEHFAVGLSICYDVRFAGLYRNYAKAGAHILTIPAAFTVPTGRAHWETLLRARAIETGSYVLAAAQGGHHADGRETWGHSMIINPWGDILSAIPNNQPGYIITDLDLENVHNARTKIPAWQLEQDYSL